MQNLKITLIQTATIWHNIESNLALFGEKIQGVTEETDIILLPETFSTGFTMDTNLAEGMDGKAVRWLQDQSQNKNCVIAGSLIIEDKGSFFNRLIWMKPDGNWFTYDKRHLFSMAEEDKFFTGGDDLLIQEIKGWKICPLICYDLRFPVWSRNKSSGEEFKYDLAFYVANWPAVRIIVWDALLKARAIENLCYIAGLNRIGKDGMDIEYNGHSCVIEPKGGLLFFNESDDMVQTIELDKSYLEDYRSKFPVNRDADDFSIEL